MGRIQALVTTTVITVTIMISVTPMAMIQARATPKIIRALIPTQEVSTAATDTHNQREKDITKAEALAARLVRPVQMVRIPTT